MRLKDVFGNSVVQKNTQAAEYVINGFGKLHTVAYKTAVFFYCSTLRSFNKSHRLFSVDDNYVTIVDLGKRIGIETKTFA